MKRITVLLVALLLTGCGETPAASPSPTETPLVQRSFTYMSDLKAALYEVGLACPDYTQVDPGADTNIRETGTCSGMQLVLLRVNLQGDSMKPIRGIYSMRYPYTFIGTNWVIGVASEANAKTVSNVLGVQPYSG